jgi:hypothetical protein
VSSRGLQAKHSHLIEKQTHIYLSKTAFQDAESGIYNLLFLNILVLDKACESHFFARERERERKREREREREREGGHGGISTYVNFCCCFGSITCQIKTNFIDP